METSALAWQTISLEGYDDQFLTSRDKVASFYLLLWDGKAMWDVC